MRRLVLFADRMNFICEFLICQQCRTQLICRKVQLLQAGLIPLLNQGLGGMPNYQEAYNMRFKIGMTELISASKQLELAKVRVPRKLCTWVCASLIIDSLGVCETEQRH